MVLFVRVLTIEGKRMLLGVLTLPFVAAYIISCPNEYRSRSVRDDCSSLSFKRDLIIKLNLLGMVNLSDLSNLLLHVHRGASPLTLQKQTTFEKETTTPPPPPYCPFEFKLEKKKHFANAIIHIIIVIEYI